MRAASFSIGWLSQAVLRYYGEPWWHRPETRKVLVSEDAREGPLAFAQKRKPNYKGR